MPHDLTSEGPPSTLSTSLAHMAGVAHGFYGRKGGVSEGIYASLNVGEGSGDRPDAVATNRAQIARSLHADHIVSCYQIHSADVVQVQGPFAERPRGDAMVTRTAGLALCILTADCVPVLFADPEQGVIGAAHAGWKGALGGVCEAAIEAMESLGAVRANITAAIGPAIAQASYEVGPDLQERFLSEAPWSERYFVAGKGDRLQFDLTGFVRAKLVRAGLNRIDLIAHDTCAMEEDYFSNRRRTHRSEPDYGRNASVIMLRGE